MPTRALIAAALLASAAVRAEPVVIGNPSNPAQSLTRDAARKLLLGEQLEWASGDAAEVIEARGDDAAVAAGYLELTHKTLAQVRAAWTRLVFSGQANPPTRASSQAEAVSMVSRRRWGLAIVDSTAVNGSVRILLRLIPER